MRYPKKNILLIAILSLALLLQAPVFGVPGSYADEETSPTPVDVAESPEEAAELTQAAAAADGTNRLILEAPEAGAIDAAGAESAVYYDDYYILTYESGEAAEAAYEELAAEHGEENVVPDVKVQAAEDPLGWGCSYMGFDRETADVPEGSEVTVAVIDSGVNTEHTIFADTTFVYPRNFVDDDEDGNVDPDAISDGYNHGTCVAGIIAESTPSGVKIMPLRVLGNDGSGSLTDVILALDYAEEHGADIANLSLSIPLLNKNTPYSSFTEEQLAQADRSVTFYNGKFETHDLLMICASGNDGKDIADYRIVPAAFASVYSVGSFNRSESRASSSNYGETLDFSAPGVSLTMASSEGGSETKTAGGTSYACPYISAAAAMIMAEDDSLTKDQVTAILKADSKDLGEAGRDIYYGDGCPVFNVDISGLSVSMDEVFPYTGDPITPSPVITYGAGTLTEGEDYTLTYENNTDVGEAAVTIEGTGNFTGSVTKNFQISASNLVLNGRILDIAPVSYTGSAVDPDIVVEYTADGATWTLDAGEDYTVSYEDDVEPGMATVTVTGLGGYEGTLTGHYEIQPADLSSVGAIEVTGGDVVYTGEAFEPAVRVTAELAGGTVELTEDDYTLTYSDNVDAGTALVTAQGKGRFRGSVSCGFTILPKEATPAISLSEERFTWNGKRQRPDVTVNVDGEDMASGDYTLTWPKDTTEVGRKVVRVDLKGNYTGSAEATYSIESVQFTPKVTLSRTRILYNGRTRSPSVTVESSKYDLVKGTDYTITKSPGRKDVGRYDIKVEMKGHFKGSKTVSYWIYPKGTTLKSVTGYKGKILVKWNAQREKMSTKRITGYQIQVATNKNFTKGKKTVVRRGYARTQRYVKNLKKGQTYYVRIRTYRTVDGKRIYSSWSAPKKVTTKK